MKDRLCKMGKTWVSALCLLATCGMTYSCSDDYDLDETSPAWLGSSIYNYLKDKGTFNNTVRLIDDLGYTEVLAKTGSRTLFVANDDAFKTFYENNSWGVKSYDELTKEQKAMLLRPAMLQSPYLLEMMPRFSNDESYQCLRQATQASSTDNVFFMNWNDVPRTQSASDKDYWARFNTQEGGGIWLAPDATVGDENSAPLMTHFIGSQMADANITDDDFKLIVDSRGRTAKDAHVFGAKVLPEGQDITCQNGYIDEIDKVLVTPSNMAEVIRTNGATKLFSHLLDRFSVPQYSPTLTRVYGASQENFTDSVYVKRYFNTLPNYGLTAEPAANGDVSSNGVNFGLLFDPGWCQNYTTSTKNDVYKDMASIFVPSDNVFKKYFLPGGGGEFLIERYGDMDNNEENLYHNVDQIPLDVIQQLINNLMQKSFAASVPSKYITIMNDAQDPLFSNRKTVEDFKAIVDTCLLANNGVVYVLNEVYTPAAYAAVSAPVLYSEGLDIFKWTIGADDAYVDNPNSDKNSRPCMNFSAYLKAMSSHFSFFIPTDEALELYYDPCFMNKTGSLATNGARAFKFTYKQVGNSFPITIKGLKYDPITGETQTSERTITGAQAIAINRLVDLMNTHIVVHDSIAGHNAAEGLLNGNEYFLTKDGSAIKVERNGSTDPKDFVVKGGWQIDHEGRQDGAPISITKYFDKTEATTGYGNGMAYVINHPIQTTLNTVYTIMSNNSSTEDNPYSEFFELCNGVADTILAEAGVANDVVDKNSEYKKYYIFEENKGLTPLVRFFNTYRYTVYIPTNDAVKAAIENGLPTWESIANYLSTESAVANAMPEGDERQAYIAEYQAKSKAMITCLLNFVKYHFQDNSIFADKLEANADSYESACIDNVTNRYITINVHPTGNNNMVVKGIGNETSCNVTDKKNIMVREMQFNQTASTTPTTIQTSSYAVIHQIDGVLNFKKLTNGRYDSDWNTQAKANSFSRRYQVK